MAHWPIVVRSDSQVLRGGTTRDLAAAAARRQLLAATRESVGLLRGGQLLLTFPEGYPNIDPSFTPKADVGAFLPFESGFLRIVALAEQDGSTRVPIVPVGLEYQRSERWSVTMRFGQPVTRSLDVDARAQVAAIEEQVRRLSGLECALGTNEKLRNEVADEVALGGTKGGYLHENGSG